jgi:hypothetical protein
MLIRDRIALAWRGYWAEMCHEFRQEAERMREENRDFQAQWREQRQWDLMLKRKVTGLENPTRKDVRAAMREHRRSRR